MGRRKSSFILSLLAGGFIAGASVFGFLGLLTRPQIPWASLEAATGVARNDLPRAVVRADGFEVRDHDYDFKFIDARHRIGDPVEFVVAGNGGEMAVTAPLVAFYDRGVPFVFLVTGAFGFLIGFVVFILRPEDLRARVFFWLCMAFSSSVMISGEWYGVQGRPLYLVPGVLFLFAYALTPVLLLKFALTLTPRDRLPGGPLLWIAAALFGGFFSSVIVASLLIPSVEIFRLKTHFTVFRVFFGAVALASIVILFRAFRSAPSRERRDQIRWVLYGMIVGLGPFMLSYTVPLVLGFRPLLSEEAASAFFVVLPLAMSFAILKHKFLDITIIINRSLVYSLMTMITVAVYLVSIEGLKRLFAVAPGNGRSWVPLGAAFIAAVAFAPARSWVQVAVDRAFFRRSYDYRRAVHGFGAEAAKAHGAADLLALFERALDETLPVERVGAFIHETGIAAPDGAFRRGLDEAAAAVLSKAGVAIDPLPAGELARLGFARTLPLPLDEDRRPGWLFVGPKRSGLGLSEQDVELLQELAAELAASLRRIRLQEEVIYERASREKLEELGRLKTEFISSVSHEIRTPMTSLQAISELLKSGKVADASRRGQLLDLMAGECGRLGRYLRNVLDFGRIEQDTKSYEIRAVDLNPVVAGVVEIVRSAAPEGGLELEVRVPEGPVMAEADEDAVRQALLNVIDNAIKYSAGAKRVEVRLAAAPGGGAEIAVSDHGIGIAPEDRERVFEAFYRTPEAARHDPKGVGLGLRIVKHIMDAHGGAIAISGGPGRGTTVTLKFPGRR